MTHLRVQELMSQRGWSIARLAKRARLDYSVTYRYVQDTVRAYDKHVLDKLAVALEVKVADLFGGEPEVKLDDRRTVYAFPVPPVGA